MLKFWLMTSLVVASFGQIDTSIDFAKCSRHDNILGLPSNHTMKTLCIISAQMTYAEAETVCKENQMSLLRVESKMFQLVIAAKYENLFEPEITFWIDGRMGANGDWYYNTEPNLKFQLLADSSSTKGSTQTCLAANGGIKLFGKDCQERHWAICESTVMTLPSNAKDFGIFAAKEEIVIDGQFAGTVGLIGRKITFAEAYNACTANGMAMIDGKRMIDALQSLAKQQLDGARFWTMNTTHNIERLWTYCLTRERKQVFNLNGCYYEEKFFDGPRYSKYVCYIRAPNNFRQAWEACKQSNLTLLSISNPQVASAFLSYANALNGNYWIDGQVGDDKNWNTGENIPMLYADPAMNDKLEKGKCMTIINNRVASFEVYPCEAQMHTICSRTVTKFTSDLFTCSRREVLVGGAGEYLKSLCVVETTSTFYEAFELCRNNQMNLFIVDSLEVEVALMGLLSSKAPNHFWINGNKHAGKWYSLSAEKKPIYPGLRWSAIRSAKQCLSVSSGLVATAQDCETNLKFLCEYQKKI